MSKTLKGPGLFLAQFAGDTAPFDSLDSICGWAALATKGAATDQARSRRMLGIG